MRRDVGRPRVPQDGALRVAGVHAARFGVDRPRVRLAKGLEERVDLGEGRVGVGLSPALAWLAWIVYDSI